jgi:ubiquinone/menaquinone biosynthesis C-methylase UbiE
MRDKKRYRVVSGSSALNYYDNYQAALSYACRVTLDSGELTQIERFDEELFEWLLLKNSTDSAVLRERLRD